MVGATDAVGIGRGTALLLGAKLRLGKSLGDELGFRLGIELGVPLGSLLGALLGAELGNAPVSYTHRTLPTILLV